MVVRDNPGVKKSREIVDGLLYMVNLYHSVNTLLNSPGVGPQYVAVITDYRCTITCDTTP